MKIAYYKDLRHDKKTIEIIEMIKWHSDNGFDLAKRKDQAKCIRLKDTQINWRCSTSWLGRLACIY
jgi:hypothetical protein